jgi:hypothetical protein
MGPWVGLVAGIRLVTTASSEISGVFVAAEPRLSTIAGGRTTTPSIGRTRHGLRCRSARPRLFAAIAHVKLGLAIEQLIFSFQRRARDLMGRGAGGRHSKKGLPKVLCVNVLKCRADRRGELDYLGRSSRRYPRILSFDLQVLAG